jgi:hypothetical protein
MAIGRALPLKSPFRIFPWDPNDGTEQLRITPVPFQIGAIADVVITGSTLAIAHKVVTTYKVGDPPIVHSCPVGQHWDPILLRCVKDIAPPPPPIVPGDQTKNYGFCPNLEPMTVKKLLTRSLRLLDVVGFGEELEDDIASDALDTLNEMLDAWRIERMFTYQIYRVEFPLKSGVQDYTIGPSGDWVDIRPVKIEYASLVLFDNPQLPVELPLEELSTQRWRSITVKGVQSTISRGFYYEPSWPNGTIHFWPVPLNASNTVALYLWKAVDVFCNLDDVIYLPPAYLRAIRYNLAIELNADYRKQLDPKTLALAISSKTEIERLNEPMYELGMDPALLQRSKGWNWRTGDYNR